MRFFFVFIFLSVSCFAQRQLSDKVQVSLLTIGPGEELYSTFGHSAIRFYDPVMMVDEDFNYGTFDFNTEGFYIKFLRGQLPYIISSNSFPLENRYWQYQNREVKEQILNLTQEQKEKLFGLLIDNMRPENREYSYKFFYDNCSTRLKDILDIATDNQVNYNQTLHADSSYREWIDKYAIKSGKFWSDFGMDISIGLPSDQKTGWKGAIFLPDNLHDAFKNAKINGQDLVATEQILYQKIDSPISTFNAPFWIALFVCLAIMFLTFMKVKSLKIFDFAWFFVLGIMGIVFCLLWWGTDHGVTKDNMSLLWASPLWVIFALNLKKSSSLTMYFFLFCLACNLFFLIWGLFNLNKINSACLFIAIISMFRLFYIYRSNNNGKFTVPNWQV